MSTATPPAPHRFSKHPREHSHAGGATLTAMRGYPDEPDQPARGSPQAIHSVDTVNASSTSWIGSTPSPGPVGTAISPSCSRNGLVMSLS